MSFIRNDFLPYVCKAKDVIFFKLVGDLQDFENDDLYFHPSTAHKFFGEKESIFGYENLRVNVFYTAGSLKFYIELKYAKKLDPNTHQDFVEPDDIVALIIDKVQIKPLSSIDEFSKYINNDYKPLGIMFHSFESQKDGVFCNYEIYKADYSVPGFLEYHKHMQSFLFWFIDAACNIDTDDENWDYFIIYEKCKKSSFCKYAFVGYCTVYKFFAYPNNIRARISQILVLPPFQRKGLGTKLLQSIYNFYIATPRVLDITVEHPVDDFTRVRDLLDAQNCLSLESFQQPLLFQGFSNSMCIEACQKLKLCRRQIRRVYEILRLKATNLSIPEEYRAYRLDIKKRLDISFRNQRLCFKKYSSILNSSNLSLLHSCRRNRKKWLAEQYDELEREYKWINEKLDKVYFK